MLRRAMSRSRPRSRYQALTPVTKTAASANDDRSVWVNLLIATGEKSTSVKEVISKRTCSGSKVQPAGYCIQALATRIQSADTAAPTAVSHVAVRCAPRLTRSQPKNMTARKVVSRKKATMPSMASGAPKMSPTKWE